MSINFNTWKVTEVVAINEFLKENSDKIPANGIHYHDGYVCFMYADQPNSEVTVKNALIEYLDSKIAEYTKMMLDSDSITLYWRQLARKGVPQAASKVVEVMDQRDNQRIQLEAFEVMKKEIESGLWNTDQSKVKEVEAK